MRKYLYNPIKLYDKKFNSLLLRLLGVVFLTITLNFSSFAVNDNLLSERVQLQVDNVTLKDALKEIERQSEYTFLYNDASIDVNQMISISVHESTVKELLDAMLQNRGIDYTVIDNQIVLTKASQSLQEKKTVSGTITDSQSGEGLPGVSILEKGTNNGTITDLDGKFTISVAEEASLLISFVGYVTEEINVAGMTEVNISLVPDIISLEDVVVIGYGTIRKSDLTGAVASVSAEELQQSAVSGLDQALQGRTAGVHIAANSGTPGAAPMVMIRGMGTITNPNPLFVVDGLPVAASDVGQLNPGDIESVEILKDASASAIYGSRAGNGVVMITTKKGQDGKTQISYDAYEGVQSIAKKYDLMSAEEYISYRNLIGIAWEDSSQYENTDWQDEIFRTAKLRSHQLSFSGGTKDIQYFLSGSYFKQEGILDGTDYNRYTLRVNTSANIKPWVTVGENVIYSNSDQDVIKEQDEYVSVIISALNMDPTLPVYLSDEERALIPNPYSHFTGAGRNNITNPVGLIKRNHNVDKTDKLLGNVYVDLKPVKWLSLKTSFGSEITRERNEQFFPEFYESTAYNRVVNNLFNGTYNTRRLVWENTATFKKTFAEKHDVQLLAGYTRESTQYRLFAFLVQDVPTDPDLWYAVNSTADPTLNDFRDISATEMGEARIDNPIPYDAALVSYLGRFIYSFDRKVDITGSIRRDGSSRFTGTQKWGYFPSFAGGLKISEFSFFKNNVRFINFLKLRAGWGKSGNQEIGDYAAYSSIEGEMNYTFGTYPNQTVYPGGAPVSIGNKDLFWESTVMTNIGLDMNLLDNRFILNIDYFNRITKDMLAQVPIAYLVGVRDAPWVNRGSVKNTGVEFNAIYKNKIGDLSYNIGANIAFLKNEVLDLPMEIPGGTFRASGYTTLTSEGQPIASFYGYKTDGYWQTQDEIDALNASAVEIYGPGTFYDGQRTSPGDIRFVDVNGDGIITADDKTFIGSPHPDMTYGINIDLAYKIFDLKIFGQGVYGNELWFGPLYYLEAGAGEFNMLRTMNDYWKQEGDNPSVPRLDRNNSNNNTRFSDRYVYSGSYFRIKNIQLGISIPQKWSERIQVEKLRIYLAAQNLLTVSKYPGFDPEIGMGINRSFSPGTLDIGLDRGTYPLARSFMVGLNVSF